MIKTFFEKLYLLKELYNFRNKEKLKMFFINYLIIDTTKSKGSILKIN